jgi:hypothetical protein
MRAAVGFADPQSNTATGDAHAGHSPIAVMTPGYAVQKTGAGLIQQQNRFEHANELRIGPPRRIPVSP